MAIVMALLFPVASPNISSADQSSPEYAVKAAYIYNILRFVEWSDIQGFEESNSVDICILGENKFGQYLNPIEDKSIHDKTLRILHKQNIQQTLSCQLVFIGDSETFTAKALEQTLGDKKIVVVGDDINFAKSGGMFSFYVQDNRVRLALNKKALEKSGLRISSLLLEVCTTFGDNS